MVFKRNTLFLLLMITLLLGGCSGTRHSYYSLLDETTSPPTIYMSVGEIKEVLAIGNGFPGWWGWYPAILIQSPDIASVECKQKRSFIPFREPGVVFGGAVCYLTAHKTGETLAQYGNQFTLVSEFDETEVGETEVGETEVGETEVGETEFSDPDRWIRIVVTQP